MKKSALVLFFLGLVAFCALFIWRGVGEVVQILRDAGFGLIGIALYHVLPLAFDALAWRSVLLPDRPRPSYLETLRIRWIGESVNALLPVLSIGGEVVKLRMLAFHGVSLARAGASIVVDMTLALLTEIVFVAAGVLVLTLVVGNAGLPEGLSLGLAIASALAIALFVVQRVGTFEAAARWLSRVGLGETWLSSLGGVAEMDREIRALHARRRALLSCGTARLAAWILGTGEVWLGLHLLGSPVSLPEAFVIESLCQAVRTAGFAIPGALGVQEGGYVVIGRMLGLDDSVSLALSLARRVRDVALGVPGLLVWQFGEGRRFFGSGERSKL